MKVLKCRVLVRQDRENALQQSEVEAFTLERQVAQVSSHERDAVPHALSGGQLAAGGDSLFLQRHPRDTTA